MSQASPQAGSAGLDPFSTQRAQATVAICVVFMFLAVLAVIARFWSRRLKRTKPALDDCLIIAGLIFYYCSNVQIILQVCIGGLGHHLDDIISPEKIIINGKLVTYGQYAHPLAMGFIRWSICSFLHRIFITKSFRRAILACNVSNILWIVFTILITSFRCIPFSKNWNLTEPGTCLAHIPVVTAVAAWSLAIELSIWALPIPAVWKLQMPRHHKVALTFIFGLGIFDIGVGIGRLITVLQPDGLDFTWTRVPALQWLAIEPSIAIIVGCLCVCRPIMEKLLPKSWRQTFSSSDRHEEDHIKLFNSRNGIFQSTAGVSVSSGAGSMMFSRTEPEELQNGAVHVRSDIMVSAENKV